MIKFIIRCIIGTFAFCRRRAPKYSPKIYCVLLIPYNKDSTVCVWCSLLAYTLSANGGKDTKAYKSASFVKGGKVKCSDV